jgi:tetratricopeptide (TPR) repeat protein
VEQAWTAVHIENEYLRLMILSEIGGRVHVGLDRTNGYDFFYRQNVIKPALVGLLGPWISGGLELNWPQHHRPSSFMPVDWAVEELPDGGRTIWCSEHEPMDRMKGMHGVTVRPGSSVVELRVRLFNRTPEAHTFLWWANAAARAHDGYQSFFPPDVEHVADHAKRAVSSFPVADGVYYGVDYGARPSVDADLSWYRNIPVPTSYMVVGTRGDFFGGYDHVAEAGFVHWADHRISPGKKLWTWGNGEFGYAWDRQLTDADGPYVELMAGVYSDKAVALLDRVIDGDADQLAARALRAAIWRRLGKSEQAARDIATALAADPFDALALDQRRRLASVDGSSGNSGPAGATIASSPRSPGPRLSGGVQTALDIAHDYATAGLFEEAIDVLRAQLPAGDPTGPVHPMVRYTLACLLERAGGAGALEQFRLGAEMPADYCFPARLQEVEILQRAMVTNPDDARAPYYLGNLLYDRRRYREAIAAWRLAARLDAAFPTVHRNLGIAEFNVLGRPDRARAAYRRAVRADPADPRLLYEFDQLRRRSGEPPAARARLLRRRRSLVDQRDDLTLEYVALLNELGDHEEALAILGGRQFHPWEGGEGLVSAQWVLANLRLAQTALEASDPELALARLQSALRRPDNLGEGKHLLTAENEVHYHLGLAHRAAGRDDDAQAWMTRAAAPQGDKRGPLDEAAYWRALAYRALGDEDGAAALFQKLRASARARAREPQRIDYFATSLPTFLIFEDTLDRRNRTESRYLESLALAGIGQRRAAVRGFREVLELDANHVGAARHLRAPTIQGSGVEQGSEHRKNDYPAKGTR